MSQTPMLTRLLALIERLYTETEGFLERAEDEQLWYNRGYANGMISALTELGYGAQLHARIAADAADCIVGHEALSWGRAYLHGFETGDRETREVIGPVTHA